MANTLTDIAKTLNIGKSSVQNPLRKIFLCGGPIPKPGEPSASLRGFLIARLEKEKNAILPDVLLAEEAAEWYHNPISEGFTNLVDLEVRIAAISKLILLIVESPGSMTELGAFSFVDSLRRKLHAVLERTFQDDRSFIMDGPIARIKAESETESEPGSGGFYTFKWLSRSKKPKIVAKLAELASQDLIKQVIEPAVNAPTRSEKFENSNAGHKMLLIADLVSLGGALRLPEIKELLNGLGLDTPRKELNQHLFLLEKLNFLRKTHEGRDDYFAQANGSLKFISYERSSEGHIDRARLRSDLVAAIKEQPNYQNRLRAFDAAKKKVPK
jgi:hypothetical protein